MRVRGILLLLFSSALCYAESPILYMSSEGRVSRSTATVEGSEISVSKLSLMDTTGIPLTDTEKNQVFTHPFTGDLSVLKKSGSVVSLEAGGATDIIFSPDTSTSIQAENDQLTMSVQGSVVATMTTDTLTFGDESLPEFKLVLSTSKNAGGAIPASMGIEDIGVFTQRLVLRSAGTSQVGIVGYMRPEGIWFHNFTTQSDPTVAPIILNGSGTLRLDSGNHLDLLAGQETPDGASIAMRFNTPGQYVFRSVDGPTSAYTFMAAPDGGSVSLRNGVGTLGQNLLEFTNAGWLDIFLDRDGDLAGGMTVYDVGNASYVSVYDSALGENTVYADSSFEGSVSVGDGVSNSAALSFNTLALGTSPSFGYIDTLSGSINNAFSGWNAAGDVAFALPARGPAFTSYLLGYPEETIGSSTVNPSARDYIIGWGKPGVSFGMRSLNFHLGSRTLPQPFDDSTPTEYLDIEAFGPIRLGTGGAAIAHGQTQSAFNGNFPVSLAQQYGRLLYGSGGMDLYVPDQFAASADPDDQLTYIQVRQYGSGNLDYDARPFREYFLRDDAGLDSVVTNQLDPHYPNDEVPFVVWDGVGMALPWGSMVLGYPSQLSSGEPAIALAYWDDISTGTRRIPISWGRADVRQEIALLENGGDNYFDVTAPLKTPAVSLGTEAVTLASGVASPTTSSTDLVLDTEGGIALDDADSVGISPSWPGSTLVTIRVASDTRTVVLKDGTGNLQLSGDCSLDNTLDLFTGLRVAGNILQISCSNNAP